MQGVFADDTVGAGLAAEGVGAIAHGKGEGAAEGDGAALGEQEVVVQVVGTGAVERNEIVDAVEKELADTKEPEAEAKGVAAAVGEEEDDRPEEVELLFDGEGPEVVERQRGGGAEGVAGEVREVLKEEDKDQQRPELSEMRSMEKGVDGGGHKGEDVKGKDAEGAVGVEVPQARDGVVGLPKAAGDEEAGEGEEEDDAAPAELG